MTESMSSNRHFTRTIEDFTCENCQKQVIGDGYTNHCPECLWSKHVDINPGDRKAACAGLMKPSLVETKAGEYVITHECIQCGFIRKNKVGKKDNFESVIKIAKNR